MVNFSFSITSARYFASLSAAAACACAASSASRCARMIAWAAFRSVGSESAVRFTNKHQHRCRLLRIHKTNKPHSARHLRPPRVLRHPPVDPFEQITKLRRRDRHQTGRWRLPDEATPLQSLRKQAHPLPVVPQHLDQGTAPATEDEQVSAVRIALELLLDQQRQAV